jgi:hydroxymethylbilane synthase
MKMRVGTRGSELSLAQTREALQLLKEAHPDLEAEVIVYRTHGDQDVKTPLYLMPMKGVFERAIDEALLRGEIDAAVHSMKDCPTDLAEELYIAAVPPRRSPLDAFVSKDGGRIEELRAGSRVGTSSPRRMAFLRFIRRDLSVEPIRGNVDTRVRKLMEGSYDGVVLAEAGLLRLGLKVDYQVLPKDLFVPACGQGALAVVCRREDERLRRLLAAIDDASSRFEVEAERAVLRRLQAGCRTPVGVNFEAKDGRYIGRLMMVSPDYAKRVLVAKEVEGAAPEAAAGELVKAFEAEGGMRIFEAWRRLEAGAP